jgi:hypothetical protein
VSLPHGLGRRAVHERIARISCELDVKYRTESTGCCERGFREADAFPHEHFTLHEARVIRGARCCQVGSAAAVLRAIADRLAIRRLLQPSAEGTDPSPPTHPSGKEENRGASGAASFRVGRSERQQRSEPGRDRSQDDRGRDRVVAMVSRRSTSTALPQPADWSCWASPSDPWRRCRTSGSMRAWQAAVFSGRKSGARR